MSSLLIQGKLTKGQWEKEGSFWSRGYINAYIWKKKSQPRSQMSGSEDTDPEPGTVTLKVPLKKDNKSSPGMKHSSIYRNAYDPGHMTCFSEIINKLWSAKPQTYMAKCINLIHSLTFREHQGLQNTSDKVVTEHCGKCTLHPCSFQCWPQRIGNFLLTCPA